MVDIAQGGSRQIRIKLTEDPKCTASVEFENTPNLTISPSTVSLSSANWNTGVLATATAGEELGNEVVPGKVRCTCHPEWNFRDVTIPFFITEPADVTIQRWRDKCGDGSSQWGFVPLSGDFFDGSNFTISVAEFKRSNGLWYPFGTTTRLCISDASFQYPGVIYGVDNGQLSCSNPDDIVEVNIVSSVNPLSVLGTVSLGSPSDYVSAEAVASVCPNVSDADLPTSQMFGWTVNGGSSSFKRVSSVYDSILEICVTTYNNGTNANLSVTNDFQFNPPLAQRPRFYTYRDITKSFSITATSPVGSISFSGVITKAECVSSNGSILITADVSLNEPSGSVCTTETFDISVDQSIGGFPGSDQNWRVSVEARFSKDRLVGTDAPCRSDCGDGFFTYGSTNRFQFATFRVHPA